MSNFPKNFETEIVNYDIGDLIKNLQPVMSKRSVIPLKAIKQAPFRYVVKELCGYDACESLVFLDNSGVNIAGSGMATDVFLIQKDMVCSQAFVSTWAAVTDSVCTKASVNGVANIGISHFEFGGDEMEGFIICMSPFNFVTVTVE